MRYRLTFGAGLAAGYVLGTKAGRQRYEAIVRQARGLKDNPSVQEAAGVLQAQASGALASVKSTVSDKVSGRSGSEPAGSPLITPPPSTVYPATTVLGPNGDGPHH